MLKKRVVLALLLLGLLWAGFATACEVRLTLSDGEHLYGRDFDRSVCLDAGRYVVIQGNWFRQGVCIVYRGPLVLLVNRFDGPVTLAPQDADMGIEIADNSTRPGIKWEILPVGTRCEESLS